MTNIQKSIPTLLPKEKRTAFDTMGREVTGQLPDGLCDSLKIPNGRLLLLEGVQGAKGGFGLAHIEQNPSRMKQIKGLQFASAHAFIRFVFTEYNIIAKQADGRIVLVSERGADYCVVICQWDDQLNVWSVTTALPKRHKRDLSIVWQR